MPRRHLRIPAAEGGALPAALAALRTALQVPSGFPPAVLAEADAVRRTPLLPAEDATDLPLFTVDPPGSADLDQALHLARRPGGGYRVHYAIADVAAFVAPGGALDAEAHRRVTTLYFPDGRVPLHPDVLGEDAASLLPDGERPALLWRFDLDAEGVVTAVDVRRARVASRARLDYAAVQRSVDAGTAEEPVALLREVGMLREALEVERGGISLSVPEQEIVRTRGGGGGDSGGDGDAAAYTLAYRAPVEADGWNAQISLMTGMAAADLMLRAGAGILRTLPTAPDGSVGRLRRVADALGVDWPDGTPYAAVIRSLDPRRTAHAAFLQECTTLLRGAGYTVFSGGRTPDPLVHAAVAAPYAHATAPLRRLADRYAGELCVAAAAGREPPGWALDALESLPAEMAAGARRAGLVERGCVDIVEAALLAGRVGEEFEAVVVDVSGEAARGGRSGTVQLDDPAVVARVEAPPDGPALPLGRRLRVRLVTAALGPGAAHTEDRADGPGTAKVLFAPA